MDPLHAKISWIRNTGCIGSVIKVTDPRIRIPIKKYLLIHNPVLTMFEYLGTNWSDSSWSCCSSTSMCRAACTPSISSTLEPWPRPMTSPTRQSRFRRYVQTAVDPDLTFPFNAYPEPDRAAHLSDANLRPLVYRPSRAPYWATAPPF